jgi:hypothetical protein
MFSSLLLVAAATAVAAVARAQEQHVVHVHHYDVDNSAVEMCGGSEGCTDPHDHVHHSQTFGVGWHHDLRNYVLHGLESDAHYKKDMEHQMNPVNDKGEMSNWARLHIMEAKLIAPQKHSWQCWWLKYLAGGTTAKHWCAHMYKYHVERSHAVPRDAHDHMLAADVRAIKYGNGHFRGYSHKELARHYHHSPWDHHSYHGQVGAAPFVLPHVYHSVHHYGSRTVTHHFHSHSSTYGGGSWAHAHHVYIHHHHHSRRHHHHHRSVRGWHDESMYSYL